MGRRERLLRRKGVRELSVSCSPHAQAYPDWIGTPGTPRPYEPSPKRRPRLAPSGILSCRPIPSVIPMWDRFTHWDTPASHERGSWLAVDSLMKPLCNLACEPFLSSKRSVPSHPEGRGRIEANLAILSGVSSKVFELRLGEIISQSRLPAQSMLWVRTGDCLLDRGPGCWVSSFGCSLKGYRPFSKPGK